MTIVAADGRPSPDARHISGPFDIIGDVHGCAGELEALLARLGYDVSWRDEAGARVCQVSAPPGRRAVFVGDLVDRGPRAHDVLRIVMSMVEDEIALSVPGNHDMKFLRWLAGKNVRVSHGLDRTIEQVGRERESFREAVRGFLERLPFHLWLDGGRIAVAHAGVKQSMLGCDDGAARSFCLYGETSGETDEFGLPVRYHWAVEYAGDTAVVYGHTPVPDAEWVNNTLCIDTGCCFGGKLTALRWPERDIVSVPAIEVYMPAKRPFGHPPPRPRAEIGS